MAEPKAYLEQTALLPLLQLGIETFLRENAESLSEQQDPLNWLAMWLMRHHPEHCEETVRSLAERAAAAADAAAAEAATEEAAAAAAAAAAAEEERVRRAVVDDMMRSIIPSATAAPAE